MPLMNYVCGCNKSFKKYFKSAKDAPSTVECVCGLKAKKSFGAVSSSHLVTIDNGLMSRAIHVDPNIMEINDERSSKDYTEQD
jgi:hypothetical protein